MKETGTSYEKEQLVHDFPSFLQRNGHFEDRFYNLRRHVEILAQGIISPNQIKRKLEALTDTATEEGVRNSFNMKGEDYGVTRESFGQQKLLRWMLNCGVRDVKTLSIGSGPAFHELYLARKGVITEEIVGVDFAEKLLDFGRKIAKKNKINNVTFINKSSSDIDYQEEFGQVFIIDSLHWMDDWQGCLQRSKRALADGGKLFIAYVDDSRKPISLGAIIKTLSDCGVTPLRVDELAKVDRSGTRTCVFAERKNLTASKISIPVYRS